MAGAVAEAGGEEGGRGAAGARRGAVVRCREPRERCHERPRDGRCEGAAQGRCDEPKSRMRVPQWRKMGRRRKGSSGCAPRCRRAEPGAERKMPRVPDAREPCGPDKMTRNRMGRGRGRRRRGSSGCASRSRRAVPRAQRKVPPSDRCEGGRSARGRRSTGWKVSGAGGGAVQRPPRYGAFSRLGGRMKRGKGERQEQRDARRSNAKESQGKPREWKVKAVSLSSGRVKAEGSGWRPRRDEPSGAEACGGEYRRGSDSSAEMCNGGRRGGGGRGRAAKRRRPRKYKEAVGG
jgi:hypothetical protein